MARKEQDLRIDVFGGVDRFLDSSKNPPNQFQAIKNMHVVSPVELRSIYGVTNVTGATIPGVTNFIHSKFINRADNTTAAVLLYKPSDDTLVVPSGQTYATGGGSPVARDVVIEYVGPGGIFSYKKDATSIEANGLTITTPTNIPEYIVHINIYIQIASNDFFWAGSLSRRAGAFAASIVVFDLPAPIASVSVAIEDDPSELKFLSKNTTGGVLVPGTTYFFGITPWVPGINIKNYNAVSFQNYTNAVKIFSATVAEGHNALEVWFAGMAGTAGSGPTAYTRNILFMGITPEDMLPVCTTTDGAIVPMTFASLTTPNTVTVKECAYNSDMAPITDGLEVSTDEQDGESVQDREAGLIRFYRTDFTAASATGTGMSSRLGVMSLSSLPFQSADRRELLFRPFHYTFQADSNPDIAPNRYIKQNTLSFFSQEFTRRIFFTNNYDTPFYTNGYVIKTAVRTYQTFRLPIAKYIGLVKSRLVLGGGRGSVFNTEGQVIYSATGKPFQFTETPSATPAWNNLNLNEGDNSEIKGFGLYSQDLTNQGGPQTFLVIGKTQSVYSWSGLAADGTQQIGRVTGFASPNCFFRTKFGPGFVGPDNIYLFDGGANIVPIGYAVKDIIESIPMDRKDLIQAVYHENIVKIGYRDLSNIDREIWLELIQGEKGTERRFSGPHEMKEYSGQDVSDRFNGIDNYRISFLDNQLYRRDDTGSFLNDGQPQQRSIVINRLAMNVDQYVKILSRIEAELRTSQDENYDITIETVDGSPSPIVMSVSSDDYNGLRQTAQWDIPQRILATEFSVALENNSDGALSVYSITLVFGFLKRRRIP